MIEILARHPFRPTNRTINSTPPTTTIRNWPGPISRCCWTPLARAPEGPVGVSPAMVCLSCPSATPFAAPPPTWRPLAAGPPGGALPRQARTCADAAERLPRTHD
jgi:hypothetical protein